MHSLLKPRVEATEQMAENCMDISQSKNQRERKITSKWHVQSLYIVVFPFASFLVVDTRSAAKRRNEYC